MSTFDHPQLVQNINEGLMVLRKSQPDAMQAFGQLSRAAMGEGTVSTKHKELIALPSALPSTAQVASAFMSRHS